MLYAVRSLSLSLSPSASIYLYLLVILGAWPIENMILSNRDREREERDPHIDVSMGEAGFRHCVELGMSISLSLSLSRSTLTLGTSLRTSPDCPLLTYVSSKKSMHLARSTCEHPLQRVFGLGSEQRALLSQYDMKSVARSL